MTSALVTQHTPFWRSGDQHFFTVEEGIGCAEALCASSELLQGAQALCNHLIDAQLGAVEASAIKALLQQAKALVDASVLSVERASDPVVQVGGAGGAA